MLVLIYCDYFLWNNDCDFKLWFVGGSVLYGDSTALFSMNDQDLWQFAFDIGACCDYIAESVHSKAYIKIGGHVSWNVGEIAVGALALSAYTANGDVLWYIGAYLL